MKSLLVLLMLVCSTSLFSQISFDLKYYDIAGTGEWKEITGRIMWGGLNMVIDDDEEDSLVSVALDGNSFKVNTDNDGNVVYSWNAELDLVGEDIKYMASVLVRLDDDNDLYITIYSKENNVFLSYFAEQQTQEIGT